MRLHVFVCQTPFHVLVGEAVMATVLRDATNADEVAVLAYFGKAAPSVSSPTWQRTMIHTRRSGERGAAPDRFGWRTLHGLFGEVRQLKKQIAAIERLIAAAPAGVVIYVPHLEGAVARHLFTRFGRDRAVEFCVFPDGLLETYATRRQRFSAADRMRSWLLRAAGVRFELGMEAGLGTEHARIARRYVLLRTPVEGGRHDGVREVSVREAFRRTVSREGPPMAVFLGQEPVLRRLGKERYLRVVEAALVVMHRRFPEASLRYKPHQSGEALGVHLEEVLRRHGAELLADDRPLELLLTQMHVQAVASISSTALLTAKLLAGDGITSISLGRELLDDAPDATFAVARQGIYAAFAAFGVEVARLEHGP